MKEELLSLVGKPVWILVTGGLVSGTLKEVGDELLTFEPGVTVATGATFREGMPGNPKVKLANVVSFGEGLISAN